MQSIASLTEKLQGKGWQKLRRGCSLFSAFFNVIIALQAKENQEIHVVIFSKVNLQDNVLNTILQEFESLPVEILYCKFINNYFDMQSIEGTKLLTTSFTIKLKEM